MAGVDINNEYTYILPDFPLCIQLLYTTFRCSNTSSKSGIAIDAFEVVRLSVYNTWKISTLDVDLTMRKFVNQRTICALHGTMPGGDGFDRCPPFMIEAKMIMKIARYFNEGMLGIQVVHMMATYVSRKVESPMSKQPIS